MNIPSTQQRPHTSELQNPTNKPKPSEISTSHSLKDVTHQVQNYVKDDQQSTDDHQLLSHNHQNIQDDMPHFFKQKLNLHDFPSELFFILKRAAEQVIKSQKQTENSVVISKQSGTSKEGTSVQNQREREAENDSEQQQQEEKKMEQKMVKYMLKILNDEALIQKIDQQGIKQVNEELGHRIKLLEERLKQQNRNIERSHEAIFQINTQSHFEKEQIKHIIQELEAEKREFEETFVNVFEMEEEESFHDFDEQEQKEGSPKQKEKGCLLTETLKKLQEKKALLLETEHNENESEQKYHKLSEERMKLLKEWSKMQLKKNTQSKKLQQLQKLLAKNNKEQSIFCEKTEQIRKQIAEVEGQVIKKKEERLQHEKNFQGDEDLNLSLSGLSLSRRSSLSLSRRSSRSPIKNENAQVSAFKAVENSETQEKKAIEGGKIQKMDSYSGNILKICLIAWMLMNFFWSMSIIEPGFMMLVSE